jgi:hypothetical protein
MRRPGLGPAEPGYRIRLAQAGQGWYQDDTLAVDLVSTTLGCHDDAFEIFRTTDGHLVNPTDAMQRAVTFSN